jgi:hypothetical protein
VVLLGVNQIKERDGGLKGRLTRLNIFLSAENAPLRCGVVNC